MKIARSIFFCLAGLSVLIGIVAGCASHSPVVYLAPANSLRIGAAEVDITPPVGHRMAGYFDERLSTGVHDPLNAKAIVIQQGMEEIAMVYCDLVGFAL